MKAYNVKIPKEGVNPDDDWGTSFLVVANDIVTVARRYPNATSITLRNDTAFVIGREKKPC